MNNHVPANAAYILKKHGVVDTITDIKIVDEGPDDLSLIVSTTDNQYFIDAADYLPKNKDITHVLTDINAVRLDLMSLTEQYGGQDAVEMFDAMMFCRVYRIIKS